MERTKKDSDFKVMVLLSNGMHVCLPYKGYKKRLEEIEKKLAKQRN